MNIYKQPFQMSFAGNPMRYILTGNAVAGVFSEIQISFANIDITVGHCIVVVFNGITRTFTLKAYCASEDDLPVADDAWIPYQWCYQWWLQWLDDVQLSLYYSITIEDINGTFCIVLTAKTASPLFDWTVSSNSITGITVTNRSNGVAPIPETVEGLRMQVKKNGSVILGEDYKPLDAEGNVKFEIQEYIYASLLLAAAPRFNLSLAGNYVKYDDYILKYLTSFALRIAGELQQRTVSTSFCYAIAGGLNREDHVGNNSSLTDYFSLTSVKKRFLTWSPATKLTDKIETHSLFFAIQEPSCSYFKLKANLYSKDTGEQVDITNLIAVDFWHVFEFLAGYDQLNLRQYMNGDVIKWELFLVDENNTVISDYRQFELDEKYYENTRYFRFRNSWGTYDSLRCTGVFETIVEHDREKVLFVSDETETSYNTPGAYSIIKEAQSFKANTGWLSKDYLNYLRDFMLSSDIYEVEDGRLLKCLLTSKKTSLFKDTNYNYSLAFEYERAYDDFFFQGLE